MNFPPDLVWGAPSASLAKLDWLDWLFKGIGNLGQLRFSLVRDRVLPEQTDRQT